MALWLVWCLLVVVQAAPCPIECVDPLWNGTTYWEGISASKQLLLIASKTGAFLSPGDVVMIIQMQGGSINNENQVNYGAGNGNATGFVDAGEAGKYEFATVRTALQPGTEYTLVENLSSLFNRTGNNRFQVIRVPLCTNITINNPVIPKWDGRTGGVLVVLADHIIMGEINLSGKGFRGAPDIPEDSTGSTTPLSESYRDNIAFTRLKLDIPFNGPKGEGFIGQPRYPDLNQSTTYPEEYDCGMGAPGNAGGGGIFTDAGGGVEQTQAREETVGSTNLASQHLEVLEEPLFPSMPPKGFSWVTQFVSLKAFSFNRSGGGGGGTSRNNVGNASVIRGLPGGGILYVHAYSSISSLYSRPQIKLQGGLNPPITSRGDGGPGGTLPRHS